MTILNYKGTWLMKREVPIRGEACCIRCYFDSLCNTLMYGQRLPCEDLDSSKYPTYSLFKRI